MMMNRSGSWRGRAALFAVLAITLVFSSTERPRASATGLVISQVYGSGGNTNAVLTNDFIELFNAGSTPVSLAGLSVQYASATGTGNFGANSGQLTALPAYTLQPGHYFLIQESGGSTGAPMPPPNVTGAINLSGSAGKVALVSASVSLGCNGGSTPCSPAQLAQIIDLVGYGNANFYEGAAAPTLSAATAALRNGGGYVDTNNNAADFTAAAPNPRNSDTAVNAGPTGVGSASPASGGQGTAVTLMVTVTPGTNPPSTVVDVTVDLTGIGGNSAQGFYDDGTHGDVVAADNVFTFQTAIGAGTTAGSKSLPATIRDALGRTGRATIAVTVEPTVIFIHDIQGPGSISPMAGQLVATTGIVTGVKYNGFFIETPDAQADADPNTSEGVFVFTNSAPPASATVGTLVKVVGNVQEYIPSADPSSPPMTEIVAPAVTFISSGNALPTPKTITAADTAPGGGLEQLEKYEGMRVHVDSLTVIAPTGGTLSEANATSTSNGVFYGVITGVARPFREPGIALPGPLPAGSPAGTPRFDGNPERLRVDSDGLLGAAAIDVASGATVLNLTGPLDYGYRTYTIDQDPSPAPTVTGAASVVSVPAAASGQFTIATFNLQRFFDTADDLATSDAVLTPDAFAIRVKKASLIIRNVMRAPDIIGVQEVENLATLQAIASQIDADAAAASQAAPNYTPYLVEGNDIGGIDVGFLVKAQTVSVLSCTQVGKGATFVDPRDQSVDILNDRPPLVLLAEMRDLRGGPSFPVTVIVNHLRSLSDVESQDPAGLYARAKRQKQAEFLADLIQTHQAAGEQVVSVGDYNAYQFNDGYVDVVGTILGAPASPDMVMLPSPDLVDPNLSDLVNLADAAQRYSYIQDGNAQVLDHILVSSNLLTRVASVAFGRCDADSPDVLRGDAARPERLSDHDPMVAYFTFPTADLAISASGSPDPVTSGSALTYTVPVTNSAADAAVNVVVTDKVPAGITPGTITAPGGWVCSKNDNTVTCTAPSLAGTTTATITIDAVVDCQIANDAKLANQATVTTTTYDPDLTNNASTFVSTVHNPAPAITLQPAVPAVLWPVNHKMVNVKLDWEVSDNCGVPTCSVSVTSNEPMNGPGDGNSSPDSAVLNPHAVQLRAERSGNGPGRIYTIAVTCHDGRGNTSTATTLVTVPKSQGQK